MVWNDVFVPKTNPQLARARRRPKSAKRKPPFVGFFGARAAKVKLAHVPKVSQDPPLFRQARAPKVKQAHSLTVSNVRVETWLRVGLFGLN